MYFPIGTMVVFHCLGPCHSVAEISAPGIAADISAPRGIAADISAIGVGIAAAISATGGIAADISVPGIAADISAPGVGAVLCRWRLLTVPTQGSRHHSMVAVNVDLLYKVNLSKAVFRIQDIMVRIRISGSMTCD